MESLGEIAVTAQRNRIIKKILSTHFGKGKVRVRGHGADWVVKIDTAPTSVEHKRELESKVLRWYDRSHIGLGGGYSMESLDWLRHPQKSPVLGKGRVPARSGESGVQFSLFHCRTRPAYCLRSQRPVVGIPNAIGEQPIQIGKVWIAVDEDVQPFAIVLARPLAIPRLPPRIVRVKVRTAERCPTAMRTTFNVAAVAMAFADGRTAIRAWSELLAHVTPAMPPTPRPTRPGRRRPGTDGRTRPASSRYWNARASAAPPWAAIRARRVPWD